MKTRLSTTRCLHLGFRRTNDKHVIYRSRRFNFWLFLATAFFNGVVTAYRSVKGNKDGLIDGIILTTIFAFGALILGVRILRSRSGLFAKTTSER